MRNPNGYGSVVKLSGTRRKPYQARKTTGFNEKGHPIYLTIGYYPTREEGMIALAEYNKEPINLEGQKITVEQLFEMWVENKSSNYALKSQKLYKSAYSKLNKIQGVKYKDLRLYHMQDCVSNVKPSMQSCVKNVFNLLDKYALELDIVTRTYSQLIVINNNYEAKRERKPFNEDEIKLLWDYVDVKYVDIILIYIYTGFRLNELLSIKVSDVDLENGILVGGLKTKAGKNRKVPIHSKILPLILKHYKESNEYLFNLNGKDNHKLKDVTFKKHFNIIMENLNMDHILHETRHTFRTLLHNESVDSVIIDLLMGHVGVGSTGDKIYTHKTIEQLKTAVEKIKI